MLPRAVVAIALLTVVCTGRLAAQEYRPEDFIPLAVGNSWTYQHSYFDDRVLWDEDPSNDDQTIGYQPVEVTLEITHTEVIGGHTYYVFSEPPYTLPPLPPFCLAGTSARLNEEGCLLVRLEGEDRGLFDLNGIQPARYSVAIPEGQVLIERHTAVWPRVQVHHFTLDGPGEMDVGLSFLSTFGPIGFVTGTMAPGGTQGASSSNELYPLYAVLAGTRISYHDAVLGVPSIIEQGMWGRVKRSGSGSLWKGGR